MALPQTREQIGVQVANSGSIGWFLSGETGNALEERYLGLVRHIIHTCALRQNLLEFSSKRPLKGTAIFDKSLLVRTYVKEQTQALNIVSLTAIDSTGPLSVHKWKYNIDWYNTCKNCQFGHLWLNSDRYFLYIFVSLMAEPILYSTTLTKISDLHLKWLRYK